ncbi:hypothetical protein DPMN_034933 [Dreissena polymorpha]|uniref:Uncharacterized protein n=1 Tax=Dreissena polymorpha TaxID=45954 RepID=A0A9D4MAZ8_DREPO|nr:hypothetical protein DPMN_034933 [Dreissena polymorpha]
MSMPERVFWCKIKRDSASWLQMRTPEDRIRDIKKLIQIPTRSTDASYDYLNSTQCSCTLGQPIDDFLGSMAWAPKVELPLGPKSANPALVVVIVEEVLLLLF